MWRQHVCPSYLRITHIPFVAQKWSNHVWSLCLCIKRTRCVKQTWSNLVFPSICMSHSWQLWYQKNECMSAPHICISDWQLTTNTKHRFSVDNAWHIPNQSAYGAWWCAELKSCLSEISTDKEGYYKHIFQKWDALKYDVRGCICRAVAAMCWAFVQHCLQLLTSLHVVCHYTKSKTVVLAEQASAIAWTGSYAKQHIRQLQHCRQRWAERSHKSRQDHQWQTVVSNIVIVVDVVFVVVFTIILVVVTIFRVISLLIPLLLVVLLLLLLFIWSENRLA